MMSPVKQTGKLSQISTKSVKWSICNFLLENDEDLIFASPDFQVSNYIFHLEIYPNGNRQREADGFVSLYLEKTKVNLQNAVKITFRLKSAQNEDLNEKNCTWNPDVSGTGYGFAKFIQKSELIEKKEVMIPSGILTVTCTVEVEDDKDARIHKLATDLKDMYISKKNTDITLEVKGEKFSAHRFILTARSPVFAAMFENNMTEQKTGFIDIPDCDPKGFGVFLLYLYSGELKYEDCDILLLYRIADKYDVPELNSLCVDFISRNITIENFCETYVFGHQFHENELLDSVQNFFEEKFEEIFSSDSWISLMEDDGRLANSLLRKMAPKIKLEK